MVKRRVDIAEYSAISAYFAAQICLSFIHAYVAHCTVMADSFRSSEWHAYISPRIITGDIFARNALFWILPGFFILSQATIEFENSWPCKERNQNDENHNFAPSDWEYRSTGQSEKQQGSEEDAAFHEVDCIMEKEIPLQPHKPKQLASLLN